MAGFKSTWQKLLSQKRLYTDQSQKSDGRNEFHIDYDRIVFCSAFRRLGKKTQVHPLSNNDHIHTRLTHSIEVSSVGRSLGEEVGNFLKSKGDLPDNTQPQDIASIVQAACLAHDIGNPPFGHAGEYAIRHWFKENGEKLNLEVRGEISDFMFFEGNAQGFRTVTKLENRKDQGGLKLTFATLGTLVKYPWGSDHKSVARGGKSKFNFYQSEIDLAKKIFHEMGLYNNIIDSFSRHPLSYLMEAADDICYKVLDIEDGYELGILRYEEVSKILIKLAGNHFRSENMDKDWSERRRIYFIRAKAIKNLIDLSFHIFKDNYSEIMQGRFDSDLVKKIKGNAKDGIKKAKKITNKNIFLNKRKTLLELGAYENLGTILGALITCANEYIANNKDISFKTQRIVDLFGREHFPESPDHYQSYLSIVDQVSGMTDNYAIYIANQLRGITR